MTARQYNSGGTLAQQFEYLRQYEDSDRAVFDGLLGRFRTGELISDPPLPEGARFTRIADRIMVETRETLQDAASFRVGVLRPEPVRFAAIPLTPSELATFEAVFPADPRVKAEAAPLTVIKPVPAPKPPKSEGVGEKTKKAAAKKAEKDAPIIAARRKRVENAKKKYPHYGAQALAAKLGIPRTTVRSDLEWLSGHTVKP